MKMEIAGSQTIVDLGEIAADWLKQRALPLWSSVGFDDRRSSFEEQLDFDRRPVTTIPSRLMVQARQISVYASAWHEGYCSAGRDIAIAAGRAMIERYLEADGNPGWVFSVDRQGRVVDSRRDLYAHAFALFALAWLQRFGPDSEVTAAIERTLSFLDVAFADPVHGGYWDVLPRLDTRRNQNPHMHLFEALIELLDCAPNPEVLRRASQLCKLAIDKFKCSNSGFFRETFFEDWRVEPDEGAGRVEPGHQFEWAWLIRRFERITRQDLTGVVTRLIDHTLEMGADRASGRIVDELSETGTIRKASSRLWPHAEACKALADEIIRGRCDLIETYRSVYRRLLYRYCPAHLDGGWIDHLNAQDQQISRTMPASSFYHISFGLMSILPVAQVVSV